MFRFFIVFATFVKSLFGREIWKWDGWLSINPFFEQESTNPQSNIESFDAIYYAALQVIIVAGANGVSGHRLIT